MWKGVVISVALGLGAWVLSQPRLLLHWIAERDSEVLFYVRTSNQSVALTIDDGPHSLVTPMILEVLSKYQARATFFLIGERIPGNEKIVHQILAEGHEIGNHMMTDSPSIYLSDAEFESQLVGTDHLLARFSTAKWFRPGSGWYNGKMLRRIQRHGYNCVIGSVFPYDTHIRSVYFQSKFILKKVFSGSIIVLHDGDITRRRIALVLNRVIPDLQTRGYRIVSLSELVEE